MASLIDTVRKVIEGYTGDAANGHLYLTISPDGKLFTVVGVGIINGQRFTTLDLVVHVVDNFVVVERDQTDKIIADALVQAGIPRSQIILAYAGESGPAVV